MTDIVARLRAATLDKDNFPRMDSERQVPVGLAKEAAAEIERLLAALKTQGAEIDRLCTKSLELHDDNARLRAALQAAETWLDAAYDDGPGRDAYDVVCRALEPKP